MNTPVATLAPAPVSTRQLRWDASERHFTADMSDLHGFGRVWADSCDTGLTLVSAKTGAEVVCVVTYENVDADGDTRYWILKPVSVREHFTVTIFND